MTVPDNLAGKRGKCSKCKEPVLVPGPEANGETQPIKAFAPPPVPPKKEVPAAPIDLETEAMAALADEPTEADREADFIEFHCPQCDEPLKLSLDLAGKRHPCPECRRIIAVPYPKNKEKLGWRNTGPKLPVGARRDEGPAPEGAWGTGGTVRASDEGLMEVGVIKEKEKPRTLLQKVFPYALVGTPMVVLLVGGLYLWSWMVRNQEKRSLNVALKAANAADARKTLGIDALLVLHGYAGEYYLNSQKPGCASQSREQHGKAVAMAQASRTGASDAFLADLAVWQVDLAGNDEEIDADRKLKWADTQKIMGGTLRAIDNQPGRLNAIRRVLPRLVEAGQIARVMPLVTSLFKDQGADYAEAVATAGLEFVRLNRKEEASKAASDALKPYDVKKNPPPLRWAVVSLAVLLDRKPPSPGKAVEEEEADAIGRADALARQGKLEEARRQAERLAVEGGGRLRALIALAVAAVESKNGNEDLDKALAAARSTTPRPELAWPLLRLVHAGQEAGLSAEQLEPAVAAINEPGLAGWGRLLLLRARLKSSRSTEGTDLAESIPGDALGGLVARLELARHNARRDRNWVKTVNSWEGGSHAVGSLGVALGIQGSK